MSSTNIAHENLYFKARSLELYKKGTYAIEVHRAPRKLKLLGWARTLTQHIDQLIELVAMIHHFYFRTSICLPWQCP